MTKPTMTAAELVAKRIQEMPLHPDYKPVDDLPIPLHKSVLVRKDRSVNIVLPASPVTSTGGIIIPKTADNSQDDKTGIIYAIGPDCGPFVKSGLRCQFNYYVDTYFWHTDGETYYKMHENDVFYIVPNDKTAVHNGVKKPENVRHEKKFQEQKSYLKEEAQKDANEKDKRLDKTKGKVKKLK